MSQRDQFAREIEKLTRSSVLHGSESLCKMLLYLGKQALDHPGTPVKEYQLATEVFGRPADFDPSSDSTIRVQASRLRVKLTEYYGSEGADDPVIVELPKGSYALTFHHRSSNGRGHAPMVEEPPDGAKETTSPRRWLSASLVLVFGIIAIGSIVFALSRDRRLPAAQAAPAPEAFQVFWNSFVSDPADPWVIFSNAAFVGRPETGMRYFNSGKDTGTQIWDHYTGVGEVLAVHQLDQAFGLFGRSVRVKRGSLFSLDDAENNNLIFVGSPSENLTLSDIPSTKEFIFQRMTAGPRKGDLALVNKNPKPGEPESFLASPVGVPMVEDYAVVGLVPGLNPSRSVLILAGTTTFGTQAAAEYVCRQNSLQQLLSRLSATKVGDVKPFEALLRVKVSRGVPVDTELVSIRMR
jgi:hypothetical protein